MTETPAGPSGLPAEPPPRRTARMSRARLDAATLAAVLVPVLAVLLTLLVRTGSTPAPAAVAPEETALGVATVVCPPGGTRVAVASVAGATGDVDATTDAGAETVEVAPDRVSKLAAGRGSVVLTGRDDLAPGLVASRFSTPLATTDCRAPQPDLWFTGVGAGARHRSVLQLVNPDGGRALVDVVVLGRDGPVDAPALRGLAIGGGETRVFDLARTLPRRDDLALHVRTLRGRISASVLDAVQQLGGGPRGQDGLGGQDGPRRTNRLLGLSPGMGQRVLVLANPSPDEGRATIRLIGADAIFTPSDLPEVVLPPQSVVRVQLGAVLREAGDGDDRPYGVQVESTVPATAALTMFVRGDLVRATPTPALAAPATTPLPGVAKQTLVLGGARGQGVVTVRSWDADGTALADRVVEVGADRGFEVSLPRRARLVTVVPQRTVVSAVVLASDGDGATIVRLREPVLTGLVPHVAPALP